VLRWKFAKYSGALQDVELALKSYGSSAKAGPLAAAFSCFARICVGSVVRDRGSCSKEMQELVAAWERAEEASLRNHALGQGLFHPREEQRLAEPSQVLEGVEAHDGSYVAATGVRIGYMLLKNQKDTSAPLVVHFHGTSETAADYRTPVLAQRYRDLPVHLLVVDYRGYGWSGDQPSLATFLRDAEPLAEKLPEIAVQHGLAWPYPGGLILSGRSLGAQVAVHLAALYPALFRGLVLDSAMATSATGDRLGRAQERNEALERWRTELGKASLEILQPLSADMWCLSTLEKIRAYDGQLLVLHGLADETVPYDGSESLHAASTARRKELVLVEGAGHNSIGHFQAYWDAQRRFALKIQLEDSLPKVGTTLEHLCAVCAEKAVSKCGRCQKVWYCGRKHQAEHWKSHKMTCGDAPPEPKTKVEPEAEACIVAAAVAEVAGEADVAALRACLLSVGAQEEPPHGLYLSWHADSQVLAKEVGQLLEEVRVKHQGLAFSAVESQSALSVFEHVKAVAGVMAQDAPAHAWVSFLELGGLWSRRYTAVLLPALRRAAADLRTIAVSCLRHAQYKGTGAARTSPEDAEQVAAALDAGEAALGEETGEDLPLSDVSVRIKVLNAFLEATPPLALAHVFCGHRFRHRLRNTYGKRLQVLSLPEGEWMRWVSPALALAALGTGGDAGAPAESGITAFDKQKAHELFQGTQQLPALGDTRAEVGHGDAEASADTDANATTALAPAVGRFSTVDDAVRAMVGLRRAIERRTILYAGESMPVKDARAAALEQVASFLEEVGLHEVVGIQRWAKETSATLTELAARQFSVELLDGAPK